VKRENLTTTVSPSAANDIMLMSQPIEISKKENHATDFLVSCKRNQLLSQSFPTSWGASLSNPVVNSMI
jgi:hypothetical protein